VTLLDLGKEESITAASANKFVLALPSKGNFDLRFTNPAQGFLLASSLVHHLALVLEPRESQWLIAKLQEIDGRMTKWGLYESVQMSKNTIRVSKLNALSALAREMIKRKQRLDGVMKLLLQWTTAIIKDGSLQESQPSLDTALYAISLSMMDNESTTRCIATSNLADVLKHVSQPDLDSLAPLSLNIVTDILRLESKTNQGMALPSAVQVKRRKVESTTTIDGLFKQLLDTLSVPRNVALDYSAQLCLLITESWHTYNELQKCKMAESIGYLACTASGKLKLNNEASSPKAFRCSVCDGTQFSIPSKQPLALDLRDPLLLILQKETNPVIKVAAVRAVGRLLVHDASPDLLNITKSPLADILLVLLGSENRDQRIAATQILPLLVRDRDSEHLIDVISDNRQRVFRQLRKIQSSNSREKPLLETTVMAYSEIGKVTTQTELSYVLSYLVDFLGHNNSFIAALAYRQILSIAVAHGQSTWQMFSPFWPTISIKIIEQMRSRPQILQRLADILEIRDSVFLIRTQKFTVPFLVLGRHRDVLEQMSLKMGVQVWEMLKENMPYILAGLFTQDARRTEEGIQFLVALMASNKSSETVKPTIDTKSLIFSTRTPLTIELLKMLASESDARRERVFQALQIVAAFVSEKPIQEAKGAKAQEFLKFYLQNNILELMNHFTDIITDKRGRKTFTEKIGCIAGIQEILRFAAAASKAALPQVFTLGI
jgi:HEAT repeat protein